jgi:AP endonuclease-1
MHLHAGYNLSTESGRAKMMEDFMQIIGIKYLKAIHVNDSKGTSEYYVVLVVC